MNILNLFWIFGLISFIPNDIFIESYKTNINYNLISKTRLLQDKKIKKHILSKSNNENIENNFDKINYSIVSSTNKINSILKLIRAKNILPTVFLSFTGGWIMNPSFINLIHNIPFIISMLNTVIIMSNSMIINDIYDIEIDRINNNNAERPLVTGELTKKQAIIIYILLTCICEYLNLKYLPSNLQTIIRLATIQSILYTPIFKRIIFLKNISCAFLVSYSLFFSGLAGCNTIMSLNKNFDLLVVTINLIFFGSLTNEILLDIKDFEGDKKNNIKTFVTCFGKNSAWYITFILFSYNIISSFFSLGYLYDINKSVPILIVLVPCLNDMYKIKINNFSKTSIDTYMKKSNKPLLLSLIYISLLAI